MSQEEEEFPIGLKLQLENKCKERKKRNGDIDKAKDVKEADSGRLFVSRYSTSRKTATGDAVQDLGVADHFIHVGQKRMRSTNYIGKRSILGAQHQQDRLIDTTLRKVRSEAYRRAETNDTSIDME
ncbi:2366_t:CDS:2 [Acaulospora colombiana]|uniref:2366_t:CDS:1 n=1 Tax=Acaulospora colombiana TaxID=27376 RepID=A0ACA9LNC7_9GLOM|nr:2366_t:CDS:2 [Acaulospora colombiana]